MNARLIEGVDYYMEAGKLVFKAAFHLKRGYCCNSKCRHCPYKARAQGPARPLIVLPADPEPPKEG